MIQEAVPIDISEEERAALEGLVRSAKTEQRLVRRARVILLAGDGMSTRAIGRALGFMPRIVSKWRKRYAEQGLEGLKDAPRPGPEPKYGAETERRILAKLDERPPDGFARWTGPLLAKILGDVSADHVWRVLRRNRISLRRSHSWCESNDPDFVAKAADIVGLYLDPPENAIVLAVDEKPHIQALERAQGYLKLPNGVSIKGHGHTYKRHGTSTLFAALEVATGRVRTKHAKRRRRCEFLAFMNETVAAYPGREIHVVLDNLNTHKPKRDRWLARHPNVHFHFTPTYASWLNQVEIWFSILSRAALKGASFTSPRQLREAIDAFIKAHNENPQPFQWRKEVVHAVPLKKRVTDLRK